MSLGFSKTHRWAIACSRFGLSVSVPTRGPIPNNISLLDITTGHETPLIESSTEQPQFSPRGDSFILTAYDLRLFAGDGRLLRTITPAAGTYVWDARWSADGSRFAYVVGPAPQ